MVESSVALGEENFLYMVHTRDSDPINLLNIYYVTFFVFRKFWDDIGRCLGSSNLA